MYTHETVFRGNIFARASSIGNKFTASTAGSNDTITVRNLLLHNNLYVEGELGISAGGNADRDTGFRWENIQIMHNVLLHIGRGRPTNRTLAWGIVANDWNGGRIAGNILAHYGNADVRNIRGIHYFEHGHDIEISANTCYGLDASAAALRIEGVADKQGIHVFDNAFQLQDTQLQVIHTDYIASGTFSNNSYFTDRETNAWFRVQGTNMNATQWMTAVSDVGSRVEQRAYEDPGRTIATYQVWLGNEPTLEAFLADARKQNRFFWRPAYTAAAVNRHIRTGFN